MHPDEARLSIMRLIEQHPTMDQRALARELNLSLGKVNYCLRALVDKGYVKLGNFQRSPHKSRYRYKLTPAGLSAKLSQTRRFLERKQRDYEMLRREIEYLQEEVESASAQVGNEQV